MNDNAEMLLNILFGLGSVLTGFIEARFFICISGFEKRTGKRIPLSALYVLYLACSFSAGFLVQYAFSFAAISTFFGALFILASHVALFAAMFFFCRLILGMRYAASANAAMIVLVLRRIMEGTYSFLMFVMVQGAFHLLGAKLPAFFSASISLAAQIILYQCILRLVGKEYWPQEHGVSPQYLSVILFPCAMLIFTLEQSFGMVIAGVSAFTVYTVTSANFLLQVKTFFATALSYAVFFASLAAHRRITDALVVERETKLLEEQVAAQKKYMQEAKERYETYRSFRHDLHNHFLALGGLIAKGDTASAADYLRGMDEHIQVPHYTIHSGNPVLDALLSDKFSHAQRLGMVVSHKLNLPHDMGLDDFDLCVILANLLDNAIAASSQMSGAPYLGLTIGGKAGFVVIEVRNGGAPFPQIRPGIGLRNVEMTAQKYGGAVHIQQDEEEVAVSVLLCLPSLT